MLKLKASKDRKVANGVNTAGTQAAVPNTFGLPAGSNFSCGGMTEICETVCYADRLEVGFPSVRALVFHNWDLVKDATQAEAFDLLDELVCEFVRASNKRGLELIFRIHWDGDFFAKAYTSAWVDVIRKHSDVHFWTYTRQAAFAVQLFKAALPNLALYFSADKANMPVADMLRRTYGEGIRLAMLAPTFAEGQAVMREITGKPGGKCPENMKAIPLISEAGSACAVCRLCVFGKADIVFSSSKT